MSESNKVFKENMNLTIALIDFFDLNNIDPDRALDIIACYLAARWVENDDFYEELSHFPIVIGQVRDVMLDAREELDKMKRNS